MPLYTIPAVIEVSARNQAQAESFVAHALTNAKKAELIFTLQSELVTIQPDEDEEVDGELYSRFRKAMAR